MSDAPGEGAPIDLGAVGGLVTVESPGVDAVSIAAVSAVLGALLADRPGPAPRRRSAWEDSARSLREGTPRPPSRWRSFG